ncbi:MAG: hypothetical protein H6575_01530 [Lewinellaceae bacterium]|nr:hypothetical protein [Lewinellaceae bacterium]
MPEFKEVAAEPLPPGAPVWPAPPPEPLLFPSRRRRRPCRYRRQGSLMVNAPSPPEETPLKITCPPPAPDGSPTAGATAPAKIDTATTAAAAIATAAAPPLPLPPVAEDPPRPSPWLSPPLPPAASIRSVPPRQLPEVPQLTTPDPAPPPPPAKVLLSPAPPKCREGFLRFARQTSDHIRPAAALVIVFRIAATAAGHGNLYLKRAAGGGRRPGVGAGAGKAQNGVAAALRLPESGN